MRLADLVEQAVLEPLLPRRQRAKEMVERLGSVPRGEVGVGAAVQSAREAEARVVADEAVVVVGRPRQLVEPAATARVEPAPWQPVLPHVVRPDELRQHPPQPPAPPPLAVRAPHPPTPAFLA